MIRDLDAHPARDLAGYDLCVVGTGPAGATLVRELVGSGLSICVLESGRERVSRYADALRRVESDGIVIKDRSRERVLGGASSTWAGLSSPLDPIDLADRPFLRRPAWPFGREELDPGYEAAAARYRFPPLADFGPGGFGRLREGAVVRPAWRRVQEKVFLAAAEPQRFGREHRAAFEADGVDLWLDATCVRLDADGADGRVSHAVARTRGGHEVRVRARAFALATGGLENARLLLASTDLCPAGLGNGRDQVGRCLMNHPKSYRGLVHLAKPVEELPYYFGCLHRGYAGYAGLRLSDAEQRGRELLDPYVRLEPLFPWSDGEGVEALVALAKRSGAVMRGMRRRAEREVVELRDWSETGDDSDVQSERHSALGWARLVSRIAVEAPSVAAYLWYRLVPGAKPKVRVARVRNFLEMEPDPENRVVLGAERDALGQPVARVRHRCTERDRRSLVALHEALGEELAAAGVGRLESDLAVADPWPVDQDASHHMGATRMGVDPATSVCDPDGRLHEVENVWCAGASLFPTSGCANPTFTIVALSVRLAAHLRGVLGRVEEGAHR